MKTKTLTTREMEILARAQVYRLLAPAFSPPEGAAYQALAESDNLSVQLRQLVAALSGTESLTKLLDAWQERWRRRSLPELRKEHLVTFGKGGASPYETEF